MNLQKREAQQKEEMRKRDEEKKKREEEETKRRREEEERRKKIEEEKRRRREEERRRDEEAKRKKEEEEIRKREEEKRKRDEEERRRKEVFNQVSEIPLFSPFLYQSLSFPLLSLSLTFFSSHSILFCGHLFSQSILFPQHTLTPLSLTSHHHTAAHCIGCPPSDGAQSHRHCECPHR